MSYSVVSYKNGSIPDDVYVSVTNILHDAFKERLQQGLDFKCGSFSQKDLRNDLKGDSYLFVAIDDNGGRIGTVSLKVRRKKGFMYGGYENLAVISDYKGKGVAVLLTEDLISKAKEMNLAFLTSSTACKATSSVHFHQKMGFIIYMKSHSVKYDSYNFIHPLRCLNILKIELIRKFIYWGTSTIASLKN